MPARRHTQSSGRAKEYADQTIKQFQKFEKDSPSIQKMEKERQQLREKMKKAEKKMAMQTDPAHVSTLKPSDLHPGDTVKIMSLNLKGNRKYSARRKGNLFVQAGIMRTKTNISDLKLMDERSHSGSGHETYRFGKVKMQKSASVSTEINLLGKTVDEGHRRTG